MQHLKSTTILIVILLSGIFHCQADEPFVPRLPINHKAYIDEGLNYLLKQHPEIKLENIKLLSLQYQYQPAPGTTTECGPNGCIIKPAAPFIEQLTVSFKLTDSKRLVTKDGVEFFEYDGLSVQFPTPRGSDWFIGKVTISERASPDKLKMSTKP